MCKIKNKDIIKYWLVYLYYIIVYFVIVACSMSCQLQGVTNHNSNFSNIMFNYIFLLVFWIRFLFNIFHLQCLINLYSFLKWLIFPQKKTCLVIHFVGRIITWNKNTFTFFFSLVYDLFKLLKIMLNIIHLKPYSKSNLFS